jgi:hypothetical protein
MHHEIIEIKSWFESDSVRYNSDINGFSLCVVVMDLVSGDVLVIIATCLNARDLASLVRVSKWIYKTLGGADVWRRCCYSLANDFRPCWFDVEALFYHPILVGNVLFAWNEQGRPPPLWGAMYMEVYERPLELLKLRQRLFEAHPMARWLYKFGNKVAETHVLNLQCNYAGIHNDEVAKLCITYTGTPQHVLEVHFYYAIDRYMAPEVVNETHHFHNARDAFEFIEQQRFIDRIAMFFVCAVESERNFFPDPICAKLYLTRTYTRMPHLQHWLCNAAVDPDIRWRQLEGAICPNVNLDERLHAICQSSLISLKALQSSMTNRAICYAFNNAFRRPDDDSALPVIDAMFSLGRSHIPSLGKIYGVSSNADANFRVLCFDGGFNVAQQSERRLFKWDDCTLDRIVARRFRKLAPKYKSESKRPTKPPSLSPLGALLRAVRRALSALFLPLLKQV